MCRAEDFEISSLSVEKITLTEVGLKQSANGGKKRVDTICGDLFESTINESGDEEGGRGTLIGR